MPIRVQCQDCGRDYTVPDGSAGKRVKCKQCGAVFAIPSAVAAPAKAAPVPKAPPAPRPPAPRAPAAAPKPAPATVPPASSDDTDEGLPVGFKDVDAHDDKPAAEPAAKSKADADAPPAFTRRLPGDLDPLDLAAAAKPAAQKDDHAVNRPSEASEAFNAPSGARRRKLKLKPGAKSYSDKPKKAAAKKVEAGHYSNFSDTPVAKLIMLIGYGFFVGLALYVAIRVSFLVLIPLAYIVGWYLFVYVPMQVVGIKTAGAIMRFKPTEPTFHLLLASNATPLALIAIGTQTGQTGLLIIMLLAVPVWFFIFMLAFRQGVVRDVVSFVLSLAMPLVITLTIQFVMAEVFDRPSFNLYQFLKTVTHMESTEGDAGDADDGSSPASPTTQPAGN